MSFIDTVRAPTPAVVVQRPRRVGDARDQYRDQAREQKRRGPASDKPTPHDDEHRIDEYA